MKKILQVFSGHNTFSGVASYLYQQYLHADRSRIRYDFFACKENSMALVMDDPVFAESKFFFANARTRKTRSTNYFKIMRELDRVLSEEAYSAVVVNTSIVAIVAACLHVVRQHPGVRLIAHAHNAGLVLPAKALRRFVAPLVDLADACFRAYIRKHAFALFGCSEDAIRVSFGKSAVGRKNTRVVHDAIELPKFRFDPAVARQVRREAGAGESTFVLGNVGKLEKRKNQTFLLDMFAALRAQRPDSQLWLVGDGPDRAMLEAKARDLFFSEHVRFLGQKTDVHRWMQGMDAFAFTTLSEGLGIVAIEAQAAGLPTIVGDGVPDDVLLSPLAKKIPLAAGPQAWAAEMLALHGSFPSKPDVSAALREAGYDIAEETRKVMDFYEAL
jgi:glycosyltransferase involved in cell wall biosynthesis